MSDCESNFRTILENVAAVMKGHGYRQNGRTLRKQVEDNFAVVGFQKSSASTKQAIKFTVNAGVVNTLLCQIHSGPNAEKRQPYQGHLIMRIGNFMPQKTDFWWLIDSNSDTQSTSSHIQQLLVEFVDPFLSEYGKTAALLELWRSGHSPGISECQREEFARFLETEIRKS